MPFVEPSPSALFEKIKHRIIQIDAMVRSACFFFWNLKSHNNNSFLLQKLFQRTKTYELEILYWRFVCIKSESDNCLMYITLTVLIHFVIDCTVQSTKKNTVHWSLADIVVHTIHNGWNKLNDRNKRESKYSLIRSWCYSMTAWKISLRFIYVWWGSSKV